MIPNRINMEVANKSLPSDHLKRLDLINLRKGWRFNKNIRGFKQGVIFLRGFGECPDREGELGEFAKEGRQTEK